MTTLPKFRDYMSEDREMCLDIFRSNMPRYFRDHEEPGFLEFLDSSGCPYYVVTIGNVGVACGGYGVNKDGEGADLCWGIVHASHHKQRIGEYLLLGRLYKISQELDAKYVRLGTCQLTEAFFEKYGFAVESRINDGIAVGLDDVEMRMQLTEENRAAIHCEWQKVE